MTVDRKCESKTKTTSIACSDAPEMFLTTKYWGGRKEFVVECLAHATASEQRGQHSEVIPRD